jgi:putative transposase
MKEIAQQRKRFGCRRIHVMLKREGPVKNHKRTERIYREEKLSLSVRRRKKLASQSRIEIPKASRPNELWAMDFLQDALYSGRKLRFLPIIDIYKTVVSGWTTAPSLSAMPWMLGL